MKRTDASTFMKTNMESKAFRIANNVGTVYCIGRNPLGRPEKEAMTTCRNQVLNGREYLDVLGVLSSIRMIMNDNILMHTHI
jgi:hypothetical protein